MTYLLNRLPSANLNFRNPLKKFYDRKINLVHLSVFEYTCFVHNNRLDKLDFYLNKNYFLGYSIKKKSYTCYNPKSKKNFLSFGM
jgi:hypothetical protein